MSNLVIYFIIVSILFVWNTFLLRRGNGGKITLGYLLLSLVGSCIPIFNFVFSVIVLLNADVGSDYDFDTYF
jgi:hypothetical protein